MSKPDPVTEAAPIDDEARAKEIARVAVLRIVVTVLGAVLVVLAIVVFSTLILRAVKGGGDKTVPSAAKPAASAPPAAGAASSIQPALPAGARVVSTALGDGRLAVTVEADGEIVTILFDAATLAETGRIRLPKP